MKSKTDGVSEVSPGWSWSESGAVARAYQAEARALVGEVIDAIRYFNIDYFSERFRHGEVGPRSVVDDEEWKAPTWRHPACDTIDFAVEVQTASGRCFTVAWESPGEREGLGLRELPARGNAFREDTEVAVWDVTRSNGWRDVASRVVTGVVMRYLPWDTEGALWCDWLSIEFQTQTVEFLLAEGQADKPDTPQPSANNIAVIFGRDALPAWLGSRATSWTRPV